jgi:GTPase
MVLVSKVLPVTKIFEAEIWTIDDSTKKVSLKYKPVLNIKNIRQVACFKQIDEGIINEKSKKIDKKDNFIILSPNEKTKVTFEFEFSPEYIFVDNHLLINDSLLKVYGIITKTF